MVIVNLNNDLNGIKAAGQIGVWQNLTYITIQADAIAGPYQNVYAIVNGKALLASGVVPDVTSPVLSSFVLDLNAGTVALTFSDIMDPYSVVLNGIAIQSAAQGGASYSLTPSSNFTRLQAANIIQISLSMQDLNGVKSLLTTGATANNTFLTITSYAAKDSSGNPVIAINGSGALGASQLVVDNVPPRLLSFELDLNQALLTFTFSETIDITHINPSGITLQNTSSGISGVRLSLTSGAISSTANVAVLPFRMVDYDYASLLKLVYLGTSITNTFISLAPGTFSDTSGNGIVTIPPTSALQATAVVLSSAQPAVQGFTFDLGAGTITLTFTKVVDITTVDPRQLTIQGKANITESTPFIVLTGGKATGLTPQVITLQLAVADTRYIKNSSLLASNQNTTFISFTSRFVMDYSGMSVVEVSNTTALPAQSFVADTKSPSLIAFNLYLNNGTIVLVFDEAITLIPTNSSILVQNVSLPGITPVQTDMYTLVITLNKTDLLAISAVPGFGSTNETYVLLLPGMATDYYSNPLTMQVFYATSVLPDTSNPMLISFSLDYNYETLLLTFDKTINPLTFVPGTVSLLSTMMQPATEMFNLTNTSIPASYKLSYILAVRLGPQELTMLKELVNLGQSINTTFVMLQNGTVLDTYGNPSVPTTVSVSTILQDTARPILTSFDLDMNNGVLVFYFSQVVIPTTFQPTFVTLQNYYSSPTANKTLTGGVISNPGTNTRALNLQLTTADIFFIKSVSNLAKTLNTTFLSTIQATAFDLYGFNSTPIFSNAAIRVNTLTPDTTPPRITAFDLLLLNSTLILYFDEPVSSSSFVPTTVILQSTSSGIGATYNITGGTVSVTSAVGSVAVTLLTADAVNVLQGRTLCTNISNCYLTATPGMVRDVVGNIFTDIPPNVVSVSRLVIDLTPPSLTGFALLDFNTASLVLNFSKLVDPASIQYTGLSLYDGPYGGSSVSLTGGTATTMGNTLTITLTSKDLNNIKLISSLCRSTFACWVRLSSTFIRDLTSNPVEPVLTGTLELTKYTPQTLRTQTMPPYIVGFSLNMNTKSLIISFNEVVLTSSFNAPAITFASDANSTYIYTLVAGDATLASSAASSLLNLTLTESAMNKIKAACLPTTANYSTCIGVTAESTYLSAAAGLVSNLFMLPSVALAPPIPATVLVSDTLPPNVVQFVSLDLNTFTASIKFSEPVQLPVNLSGFSLTSAGGVVITLHSGASSYLTTDPTVIQFSLSPADTLAIKSSSLIDRASFKVLTATSGAAVDLSGVSSLATTTGLSTVITPDTQIPTLLAFQLDLNTGRLVLTFNDVVDVNTLNPTKITLRSSLATAYPNSTYTLTGGVPAGASDFTVAILLLSTDLNTIKTLSNLIVNSSTYIQLTADTIQDMYAHPVKPVLGLQSSVVTYDVTPPRVVDFSVNLNTSTLIILFSEVVDTTTFNISAITLQDAPTRGNTSVTSYTLTGGVISPSPTAVSVSIQLTQNDLNNIKRLGNLASSIYNTYLTAPPGFVNDTSRNPALGVFGLNASVFRTDMIPPQVLSFTLDMNTGTMIITFTETVNSSSLIVSAIGLQNAASNPTQSYTLTLGNVTVATPGSAVDQSMRIQLSTIDLNEIKRRAPLATSVSYTFLTFMQNGVQDTSGNGLVVVDSAHAIRATGVILDSTSPQLTGFSMDLNSNALLLSFSETVQPRLLTYTLVSSNTTLLSGPTIIVNFSIADVNQIKTILALAGNGSFISIVLTSGAINDTYGNPVVAAINLPVLSIIPDTIPPTITCFSLNLSTNELALTFGEPVDPLSVNITRFILLQSRGSNNSIQLSSAMVTGPPSTILILVLSAVDTNIIKLNGKFATSVNNTYLSIYSGAVSDTFGVPIASIASTSAIQACSYFNDTTSPKLIDFEFTMTNGLFPLVLVLTFSEPIVATSISPLNITFQTLQAGGPAYKLTGGRYSLNPTPVLRINVTEIDFSGMSLIPSLLVTTNTTYLTIPNGSFFDLFGNPGVGIPSTAALQAAALSVNLVVPTLLSYTLDMNTGTLQLSFSQPVLASTITFTSLTLQNAAQLNANASLTLSGGIATTVNSYVVSIALQPTDLSAIKVDRQLATSKANTWLSALSGFILGTTGTPAFLVSGLAASVYIPDFTRPTLASYDVYLNTMMAVFTFSEPVDLTTFDPTQVNFQNAMSASTVKYTLTGGNSYQHIYNEIILMFTLSDENALKASPDLLTSINKTFLSIPAELVQDMNANPVNQIKTSSALQANMLYMDTNKPYLVSFTLDRGVGMLNLTFNETVDGSTLYIPSITLLNAAVNSTANYTLTLTSVLSGATLSSVLTIQLSAADAGQIKVLPLCLNVTNCFLIHDASLVLDTLHTSVIARPVNNSLQAQAVYPDTVPPVLVSFSFNRQNGVITLSFSEPVNISTLSPSAISLQTFSLSPYQLYTLTGGTVVPSTSTNTVAFQISAADLLQIQMSGSICSTQGTCWITIDSSLVKDLAGLSVNSVSSTTSFYAATFTQDLTPPVIASFSLDLSNQALALTLSEAVNPARINVSALVIQSNANISTNGSLFHRLAGYNGLAINTSSSMYILIVQLIEEDANVLRSMQFATSINNTYLSVGAGAFYDTAVLPNPSTLISPLSALQASSVKADQVGPILQSFTLNLNNGILTLTFSETVLYSSINASQITLYSSSSMTDPYPLTGGQVNTVSGLIGSYVITIALTLRDLSYLKLNDTIGSSVANTFLTVTPSVATDTFGNAVVRPVILKALAVYPDLTFTHLVAFTYNANNGQLNLTFDNVILIATFDPTAITLQNGTKLNKNAYITLTTAQSVATYNNYVVIVIMDPLDLAQLKLMQGIGTNINNTYMTLSAYAVQDYLEKDVIAVTKGIQASLVIADTIPPALLGFDLNMNSNVLSLTFSDTVNLLTFNPMGITLQSRSAAPGANFTLTGGSIQRSALNDYVVLLTLTTQDSNNLKKDRQLATNFSNTYLSLLNITTTDSAGNTVVPIPSSAAIPVNGYLADATPPVLLSFSLNLNTGILQLFFSETIRSLSYYSSCHHHPECCI
ncbi:hypothetical protein EMCRGX_G018687 [Ephydatia muelleri]